MMGKLPQKVVIIISNTTEMNKVFLSNNLTILRCMSVYYNVFKTNTKTTFL